MYEVRASLVARAVLASLITGVVGGLAIALVVRPLPLGFLYLAVMAGFGYLISEAVGRAAAAKHGIFQEVYRLDPDYSVETRRLP